MQVDALEHYYKVGWFDFKVGKWKDIDRLTAGTRWRKDCYEAGLYVRTIDPSKPRVDCQGFKQPSDKRDKAESRFRDALRAIPADYLRVMHNICIENRVFEGSREEKLITKYDLVRGLDYLCDHYTRKRKGG